MSPLRKAWHLRWSWLGSILLGAALAPVVLSSVNGLLSDMRHAYDLANPVVEMQGVLVKEDVDAVLIHMAGTKSPKRAGECAYIRVQAYTRALDGVLRDAYIRRVDMPEDGHTKPAGAFDIGVWRIWPKGEAVAVLVFALHDCGGRQVRTKIAEVSL